MIRAVLITRPEEDADQTAALLSARRIPSLIAPLLTVRFDPAAAVDLDGVQALLFTSANGARAFAARSSERGLPVLAVGDATARQARALGFSDVISANGDVADLAALAAARLKPQDGALFHGAGKDTAGDLSGALDKAGFSVRKVRLYDTRAADRLPEAAAAALKGGTIGGVLIYSPRTAETFAALTRKAGLEKSLEQVTVYCLSRAVADRMAGLPFKAVRIAARPDQDALLAAVQADLGAKNEDEPMTTDDAKDQDKGPAEDSAPKKDAGTAHKAAHKTSPKVSPEDRPTTKSEPAPASGGGGKSIVFAVAALGLAVVVAVLTLPQWREAVPESLRAYLPGVAGSTTALADQAAAQAQALADLQERVAGLANLAAGLNDRLDTLEARQAEAAGKIDALAAAAPQDMADLRATNDQLAGLSAELLDRVQQLEGRAIDPARLDALAARLDALDKAKVEPATLLNLSERVNAMDAKMGEALGRRDAVSAYILAVAQLREAVGAGAPFDAELRAAKVLAAEGTDPAAAVAPFAAYAETGVPTTGLLRSRFDEVARTLSLMSVTAAAESGSLTDRILKRLSGLINITRIDDGAGGDTGPAAIAARTAALLRDGDLTGAVAALATLEGPAVETAAAWLADAKARLSADAAMSELTANALALSARKGG